MLIGKDINKFVSNNKVLDNVQVQLAKNQISVLIGPSGSGKSTLLRALALIDLPDSGEVLIENERFIFPFKSKINIWPKITLVFQQLFLWPHLTLEENIMLPLKNKGYNKTYLALLLDIFELKPFYKRYPQETSLGEQQRTALVRALILEPDYLLLDEITSSLDYEQSTNILNTLVKVKKDTGVLLVTHQIDFIIRLFELKIGDKIYFMDKGKIIDSGGIELITSPINPRIIKFFNK